MASKPAPQKTPFLRFSEPRPKAPWPPPGVYTLCSWQPGWGMLQPAEGGLAAPTCTANLIFPWGFVSIERLRTSGLGTATICKCSGASPIPGLCKSIVLRGALRSLNTNSRSPWQLAQRTCPSANQTATAHIYCSLAPPVADCCRPTDGSRLAQPFGDVSRHHRPGASGVAAEIRSGVVVSSHVGLYFGGCAGDSDWFNNRLVPAG